MKEYDLYVPLTTRSGRRIAKKKLAALRARLIREFGGLTEFPQEQRGFWKLGTVTFRDRILILRVLSDLPPPRARRFWKEIKDLLAQEWEQQEVLIVQKSVVLQ